MATERIIPGEIRIFLNHIILGAMLGYDICQQCKRYCSKKEGIKIAV